MPFEFAPTTIPDVILVTPRTFGDQRGYFRETYQKSAFAAAGITEAFVQDNHSYSGKGILRGIHFQRPPHAQGKLVGALVGRVWDVAVDLRPDSPTYTQWVAEELDGQSGRMLYIPPGFGHGFQVLSEDAHFVYKCTAEYAPEADGGVSWEDPQLGIDWPLADPLVSEKDQALPRLAELDHGAIR